MLLKSTPGSILLYINPLFQQKIWSACRIYSWEGNAPSCWIGYSTRRPMSRKHFTWQRLELRMPGNLSWNTRIWACKELAGSIEPQFSQGSTLALSCLTIFKDAFQWAARKRSPQLSESAVAERHRLLSEGHCRCFAEQGGGDVGRWRWRPDQLCRWTGNTGGRPQVPAFP